MEIRKTHLLIDSRERLYKVYPNANDYVINLDNILKNVISVNLIYAIYPKSGIEFYVNLIIEEFNSKCISNNQVLRDSFIQLPLLNYFNEFRQDVHNKVTFLKPISKLSKLSLKFVDVFGEKYEIGEHFLRFEIEYYVYDSNPEYHTLSKKNYFLRLPKNFTKRDLNTIYRSEKEKLETDAEKNELKKQYVYNYSKIRIS
tara:strand:- start:540 stop:1139 length:600 start_codon:yes stop_codon:yes gene_type:complete